VSCLAWRLAAGGRRVRRVLHVACMRAACAHCTAPELSVREARPCAALRQPGHSEPLSIIVALAAGAISVLHSSQQAAP